MDELKCSVLTCSNTSLLKGVSFFHRFPANNSKATLWANAINWNDFISLSNKRISFICRDHFDQSCYFSKEDKKGILRSEAVPTLLLNRNLTKTEKIPKKNKFPKPKPPKPSSKKSSKLVKTCENPTLVDIVQPKLPTPEITSKPNCNQYKSSQLVKTYKNSTIDIPVQNTFQLLNASSLCRCCGCLLPDASLTNMKMLTIKIPGMDLVMLKWFLMLTDLNETNFCSKFVHICQHCQKKLVDAYEFRNSCLLAESLFRTDTEKNDRMKYSFDSDGLEIIEIKPEVIRIEDDDPLFISETLCPQPSKLVEEFYPLIDKAMESKSSPKKPNAVNISDEAQTHEPNISFPLKRLPDKLDIQATKKAKHKRNTPMKTPSITITKRKVDSIVVNSKEYKLPISKWNQKAIIISPNTAGGNENVSLKNCEKCNFKSYNKTKYNQHMLEHGTVLQELKTLTHSVYYKCKQCNIYYNKESELKIHLRQHQGAKLVCNSCLVEFASYQKICDHLEQIHNTSFDEKTNLVSGDKQSVEQFTNHDKDTEVASVNNMTNKSCQTDIDTQTEETAVVMNKNSDENPKTMVL